MELDWLTEALFPWTLTCEQSWLTQFPLTWELTLDCEISEDCSTPSEPVEVTVDLVMLVWQLRPSWVLVLDWKVRTESLVPVVFGLALVVPGAADFGADEPADGGEPVLVQAVLSPMIPRIATIPMTFRRRCGLSFPSVLTTRRYAPRIVSAMGANLSTVPPLDPTRVVAARCVPPASP
ncbi:hypothetical protein NITHO_1260005 [Nitrolancea hollandica Lb]|uniref:Uncharacterized protein n=1 Tax=Nitrolancea hollandica Lb TaxID=1129897 RepID=I4ECW0_9BACT|nr:hypothetical protein NITHO_1260005 [Nitrolancea hollandica Lb]